MVIADPATTIREISGNVSSFVFIHLLYDVYIVLLRLARLLVVAKSFTIDDEIVN